MGGYAPKMLLRRRYRGDRLFSKEKVYVNKLANFGVLMRAFWEISQKIRFFSNILYFIQDMNPKVKTRSPYIKILVKVFVVPKN